MTNSQKLHAIRRHLQVWFETHREGEPWECSESILMRDGFYCGRCFRLPPFRAVWFFEEDQVKLYRASGEIVATFQGDEIVAEHSGQATLRFEPAPGRVATNPPTVADSEATPIRRAA